MLDDKPDQFFRFEDTYPALLRKRLVQEMSEQDVIVTNLGRRACTIGHLTNVARDIVSWMSPDVTIVHQGIVDCWIRNGSTLMRRTSEADFEKSLGEFFALRTQLGPKLPVIVIGILETSRKMLEKFPEQNEIIDTYNEILRRQAHKNNVTFFDPNAGEENQVSLLHEDGHHLSRKGHEKVANGLAYLILTDVLDQLPLKELQNPIA